MMRFKKRGSQDWPSAPEFGGLLRVSNPHALDWQPEFAPGCHFCTAGTTRAPVLVFNQILAVTVDVWTLIYRRSKHVFSELAFAVDNELDDQILSIDVEISNDFDALSGFAGVSTSNGTDAPLPRKWGELHGSPPFLGNSIAGNAFYRFSAFRNDRRVTTDLGLLGGSYCTSQRDHECVPSALAAVGRYALPNPVPPVHVFRIMPPPGTPLLYGTAAPMFGQAGGGAEIEIQAPLPAGSVVYVGTIPIW